VLDAGVLLIRVLLSVLIGRVRGHAARNVLRDQLVDPIGIGPRYVAELVVEGLEDVREAVELGLGLVSTAGGWNRFDLRIGVRKLSTYMVCSSGSS
jgi:hypothetical protein